MVCKQNESHSCSENGRKPAVARRNRTREKSDYIEFDFVNEIKTSVSSKIITFTYNTFFFLFYVDAILKYDLKIIRINSSTAVTIK